MSNLLVTTAISYTNGNPHVGHLYESVLADFIKKSFELFSPTQLLTGTDEHGKKIELTAQSQNLTPIELCNLNSEKFKKLNKSVHIDFDYFIRTTQHDHKKLVSDSIIKSYNSGDIYLSNYTGYYNVREECFVSDLEAKQTNYCDPVNNNPYELITEESYFFRLEKYKNYIDNLLESDLVFPPNKLSIGDRLDNLKDLCISRTSFDWGIDFPQLESANKHIVYVWFDALLNYVTGANILADNHKKFNKTIHIIGKDILWFHAVIYPAILKSCGYNEYQADNILVHGFILDKSGIKMSKSLNNVVDVDYLINKYPIDAIRYYLIMETVWGEDIKFNEDRLKDLYNNQLIKDFGNLYQRLFTLAKPIQNELNKYFSNNQEKIKLNHTVFLTELEQITSIFAHSNYKSLILNLCGYANKELTDKKPWDKSFDPETKIILLCNLLVILNQIMILLYPIIPNKINELKSYLGWAHNNYNVNIIIDKVKAFTAI